MKKLKFENPSNEAEYSREYWDTFFEDALYNNVAFSASFSQLPEARRVIEKLMKENNLKLAECRNVPEIFSGKFKRFERVDHSKISARRDMAEEAFSVVA